MKTSPKPTHEEDIGMTMIVWLQALAGIEESDEKALKGWRAMSPSERSLTKSAYAKCGGPLLK